MTTKAKEKGFNYLWDNWEDGGGSGLGPFNLGAARQIAEALFRRTSTTQPEAEAFRNAVAKAIEVMKEWCRSEGTEITE